MSYIAGRHLPERVRLELENGTESGIENGTESILTPTTADGKLLAEAYKNRDPLALKLTEQMARYLAVCVFNIYQMLNIDTFVFGGGLTALGGILFDRMREEFDKVCHISFPVHFKIAELKEDAGIIGAAEYIYG